MGSEASTRRLGSSDGKEPACNAGDLGQSLGWEDCLEEGSAAHCSILAWRIPWTEEPGGLQSMGSYNLACMQGLSSPTLLFCNWRN